MFVFAVSQTFLSIFSETMSFFTALVPKCYALQPEGATRTHPGLKLVLRAEMLTKSIENSKAMNGCLQNYHFRVLAHACCRQPSVPSLRPKPRLAPCLNSCFSDDHMQG